MATQNTMPSHRMRISILDCSIIFCVWSVLVMLIISFHWWNISIVLLRLDLGHGLFLELVPWIATRLSTSSSSTMNQCLASICFSSRPNLLCLRCHRYGMDFMVIFYIRVVWYLTHTMTTVWRWHPHECSHFHSHSGYQKSFSVLDGAVNFAILGLLAKLPCKTIKHRD